MKKENVQYQLLLCATRLPRHMEAAAIVMYMYLYSLAFMDLSVTKRRTAHFMLNPGHV